MLSRVLLTVVNDSAALGNDEGGGADDLPMRLELRIEGGLAIGDVIELSGERMACRRGRKSTEYEDVSTRSELSLICFDNTRACRPFWT